MSARRLLGIAGSLRRRSYNRSLLVAAGELAPAGLVVSAYDDLGAVPPFDEDLEEATGGGPAAVRDLRSAVRAADGLLIATPEYNQSMPGVLKNAIDWLSREPDEVLVGKPVVLVGATTGRWGTRLAQGALRHTLAATEALVMPAPQLYVAGAAALFDVSGRLTDESTRRQLAAVLAAGARWVEVLAPR